MSGETHAQAVVFSDIAGSSRLFESLGDLAARELVDTVLSQLSEITRAHNGDVVKTIGDDVMCTFPDADKAILAAIAMHESVRDSGVTWSSSVSLRIGVHYGEVLHGEGDVFGDAVNVAARMVGVAQASEIITTRESVDNLSNALQSRARFLNNMTVHGRNQPVDIYDIMWGEGEEDGNTEYDISTTMMHAYSPDRLSTLELILTYDEKTRAVDEEHRCIQIGRGREVNFRIPEPWVSRSHASIEYRSGNFVLIDHSRVGTSIQTSDGKRYFAHRQEIHLQDRGEIRITASEGESVSVAFEIRERNDPTEDTTAV
jgi:class 3 adenylate cyclase